ncbi:hypothetical protein BBF96_03295 [Anoxybacter fermentans]|uniref:HTH cro/C1-type domain-containing protein n=1 Tax=Anoxybacter fermentans TaxID=1323375 RepID=A0A3Q9HPD6_9FIRM|nr:helix-turn-helix transcriptional regulator [Anoxybacter fermentans]AZR72490.1 hypothetical protein BBF96_03295 [Anoxybacter fermentans]
MLGQQILNFRLKKGLSQDELGELMGYTGSYISQIENQKKTPSMKFLQKFSEVSKIPIEELLNSSSQHLGLKFKQLRIEKGLKVGDISEQTGIDFFRIADFEDGIVALTWEEMQRIADILGVDSTEIESTYDEIIRIIRHNLEQLPISSEKVELILEYIERQIK